MIFSCLGKHLPLIKLKLKKLDLMLPRVILYVLIYCSSPFLHLVKEEMQLLGVSPEV